MTSPLDGMHAIGYARVSTDDKGQSTDSQINAIKIWGKSNGVIIDAIYDEEVSGKIFPRPKLSEAIITLMTGSASMLVCYDQSRLTRDAEKHLPLIKKMLGDKVIRYVVNGDADPDNFGIKILSAVKGVSDAEERKVISEKTKLKMAFKRDNLNKHMGRPARLIIADSTEGFREGMITDKTIILKPSKVLGYAHQGWPPCYVARTILNVTPITFIRAIKRAGLTEQYNQIMFESMGKVDE